MSLSFQKYGFQDPGSGKYLIRIRDPGSKVNKAPDPGSGSAILMIKIVLSSLPTAPEPAGDNSNYPDDDDIGPDGGYDMEEDQVSERALGHSKLC